MNIEVIIQIDSETREVWKFHVIDINLILSRWTKEYKPKGKRKWNYTDIWSTYASEWRDSLLHQPIIPKDIREKAILEFSKQLKVYSSEEWKAKK
jgi:hypothetical protein